MEGFALLFALVIGVSVVRHLFRVFLSVKHPNVLAAIETEEAKRAERNKKLAGGAMNAGLGIAKVFIKK